MAKWQILCDAIGIGRIHHHGSSKRAAAFRTFGGQQMTFTSAHTQDLSSGGDFETFRH